MQLSRIMAKTTVIALILLMASVMLQAMPVQAQTEFQVDTDAHLSFRPNPVGVGQTILVNMWLQPPIHVERYLTGFTVTITKPDGTKDVIGPMDSFQGDSTAWFEYLADQVGEWKLKFDFSGTHFPAKDVAVQFAYSPTGHLDAAYYKPSSTPELSLTVQEQQVLSWPPSPLPTDYWTRPVMSENREWASILVDYPWNGPGVSADWPADTNRYWSSDYSFTPYVQAPNTAHIVWKRQGAVSGIQGGDVGIDSLTTGGGNPGIIYQGRAYQSITKPFGGVTQSVWQCYDIRTGEVFWERTGVTAPTVIEYTRGTEAVPGAEAAVTITPALVSISGGRLIKYNPATGAVTLNVSIASSGTSLEASIYYMNGYALTVQNLGTSVPYAQRYRLINWTTFGTATNFAARIMNNVTWTWESLLTIAHGNFTAIDYNAGVAVLIMIDTPLAMGARYGTTMIAASLKTGERLWTKTVPDIPYHRLTQIADHGKLAVLYLRGYFKAYDLYSGKELWKSDIMDPPWDDTGFGAYDITSAYGLFYRSAYGGIYAFDWDTGKIVWKYKAPANAYETPYVDENWQTVYSWNGDSWVADGKLYSYNTEHSPSQPITRGWGLHCINATTGEGIWNITTPGAGVIADGYMSVSSSDGYQYVFGKGKSATTATASPKTIANGANILIEGTVLDQSPAQPDTPCVSKESMTTQMEYLHKQQPIDGLWHNETIVGVPVTLTAIGSDGTVIDIGTVTTNGYYGTFSKAWTPAKEDTYTITASFTGDDSYGSSSAATAVSVGPVAEQSTTPEIPTPPDYTMTIIGSAIAVIIAVAIVGVLMLRKR